MKKKAELLAPAGSFDVMKACIAAGADAVYMGLSRFSARAFADNAGDDAYLDAIHYAHLHGAKLYLTINTLFKEKELFGELYETLKPLYEAGLDAVIVQDIGAMYFVRDNFPSLPIHASTQATVTGPGGALFLKDAGVKRVVPARELSLSEIRKMRDETNMEIECFIHGALCYGYSGQCLFSSIAGGRSGNRGRCAQPCRMSYAVKDGKNYLSKKNQGYVLSLKDLCTVGFLPELLDAGVYSLKIEGRMKKAEYAAGVTSIYRKYLDLYLNGGAENYTVDPIDEKRLFSLFNRKGFSDGYYHRHNGKDMLTLYEPDFRETDDAFTEEIRKNYIEKEHQTEISGYYSFISGEFPSLTVFTELDERKFSVTVTGSEAVQTAEKKPVTEEDIRKQLLKTGGSGFKFTNLSGTVSGNVFIPVGKLNELRRAALEALSEKILLSYKREAPEKRFYEQVSLSESGRPFGLKTLVRTKEQFSAVNQEEGISAVILESTISEAPEYSRYTDLCHKSGKECILALPRIFKDLALSYFEKHAGDVINAGFDGFLLRSLEEYAYLKQIGCKAPIFADHSIYAFNSLSEERLLQKGFSGVTVPVELNYHEISETDYTGQEMILYGRLPMMLSANCLKKTLSLCDGKPKELTLIDRLGNEMPVFNECRYCMNTIFNALPLNLLSESEKIRGLRLSFGRLEFSTEDKAEVEKVLKAFINVYTGDGRITEGLPGAFTRGHFKRGVD